jgi:hypothetical protein
MQLSDDELRDVLSRAEEIQRASRHGDAWNAERAAVISAGQEVGLSRQAIERALNERFSLPVRPAVGTLAWARSADGKFHVAEVLSTSDDGASVRFLRGTEHDVAPDELRPCAIIPGVRVVVNWPWWGQWTCTVVAYDPAKRRVRLDDGWGYKRTFALSDVWLAPEKSPTGSARMRMSAALLGTGAGLGALIGAALTAFFLR